jgi:hypothetical protein
MSDNIYLDALCVGLDSEEPRVEVVGWFAQLGEDFLAFVVLLCCGQGFDEHCFQKAFRAGVTCGSEDMLERACVLCYFRVGYCLNFPHHWLVGPCCG